MDGVKGCVICGNGTDSVRVLYPRVEPQVLECRVCRLRFVDCSPTETEAYDMYDAYTDAFMQSVYESHEGAFASDFREKLGVIERLAGGKGRVLDVGCGYGQFLAAAKAEGWDVAGIDIARTAVQHCNERLGAVVQRCTLDRADFAPASFDVITMWDLVEHLPDPRPTLAAAERLLRIGGVLVIRTPSASSLMSRAAHTLYRLSRGRAQQPVRAQYNYFHLFRYSPETLRRLVAMFGFGSVTVFRENSSFVVFASQHPGLGRRYASRMLLRAFFAAAVLCRLQNKIVLACRKEREVKAAA